MIIDTLNNASKYNCLHPLFEQAFNFLYQSDLKSLDDGLYQISDGIKVLVNTAKGKSMEESLTKFECHDKNIDIQFCVEGKETLGWKPREKCVLPNGSYNLEKDVRFFNDLPDMFFQLNIGQFAIFFPEDVHAPMIGEDEIKKIIIKVIV